MDLYNQWIESLDTYTPAHGSLRNKSNQFCCLGVLCDISDVGEWIETDNGGFSYADDTEDPVKTKLPKSVQDIVELRSPYGRFDLNELSTSLQTEIRNYINLDIMDRQEISFTTINDEMIRLDANPFPIIKQILIERPPSLFIYQKAQGEHNYETL